MFHSFGTVQSSARVPVGTSWTVKGISRVTIRSVSRRPSPVMLRQTGINSAASARISFAARRASGSEHESAIMDKIRIGSVSLAHDRIFDWPLDAEGGIVPTDSG